MLVRSKNLALLFFIILMGACSKDISVGDGEGVETRNISLRTFFTHGNHQFSKDSLYEDASGNLYVIDQVKLIVSDFHVVHVGDTITDTTSFAVISPDRFDYPLLDLGAGSYTGSYGFTIGLNEKNNDKIPSQFPKNSGLQDGALYRGPGGTYSGYSFLYVQGRTFDPLKPTEVEPSLTFIYELGDTLSLMRNRGKNFTISNDQSASFNLRIQLDKLMKPFDVYQLDFIESRRNEPTDYNNALLLRAQLDSSLILF